MPFYFSNEIGSWQGETLNRLATSPMPLPAFEQKNIANINITRMGLGSRAMKPPFGSIPEGRLYARFC